MSKLISMCVQDEERLKVEKPNVAHLTTTGSYKKNAYKNGKGFKNKDKPNSTQTNKANYSGNNSETCPKCHFCKKQGHIQKECPKLREWLEKKGKSSINYVTYESFLIDVPSNTWWLDTGAMVHITNSLQGFLSKKTL